MKLQSFMITLSLSILAVVALSANGQGATSDTLFVAKRNELLHDLRSLATAVHAYRIDWNTYPTSQDQLTPAYITRIFVDPFSKDGEPLRFYPDLHKMEFRIYSVGIDGIDQKGAEKSDDLPFSFPLDISWFLNRYLETRQQQHDYELFCYRSQELGRSIKNYYDLHERLPRTTDELSIPNPRQYSDPFDENRPIQFTYITGRFPAVRFFSVGKDGRDDHHQLVKVSFDQNKKIQFSEGDITTFYYLRGIDSEAIEKAVRPKNRTESKSASTPTPVASQAARNR